MIDRMCNALDSNQERTKSGYVAPRVDIPIMYIHDAARAFLELAQAPLAQVKTVNYIVLGPTPFPTAEELVQMVRTKIPGAKLDFQVNQKVSDLIESVTQRPPEDKYARQEWGWLVGRNGRNSSRRTGSHI
jgi:nucleoside-diphosphate-sugar epimerase